MAYVDYEYYKTLYGEKALAEADFTRLLWDAEREIDKATSGVDGVRKLQVAFPTSNYDAEGLESMTISEIKALADELGYTITATKKADIITEFLAQQ